MPDSRIYVAFMPSPNKGWWSIFTRPGFEHCCMWFEPPTEPGVVVMVDPGVNYCHVGINIGTGWGFADMLIKADATVISLAPSISLDYTLPKWYWLPTTCATVIAYAIGMRTRWPMTPYGLYRKLIKAGAKHHGQSD